MLRSVRTCPYTPLPCVLLFFFPSALVFLLMHHAQDVVQVAVVVVLSLKLGRAPPYAIHYKLELLLVHGISHVNTKKKCVRCMLRFVTNKHAYIDVAYKGKYLIWCCPFHLRYVASCPARQSRRTHPVLKEPSWAQWILFSPRKHTKGLKDR